jgi:hypothetical protein
MNQPHAFLSVGEIRKIAGRASSGALPDEDADTVPVPVKWENEIALLIMYYREVGPPGKRVVHPPHYAMYLEGSTGKVLHFGGTSPQRLGILDPDRLIPGVGLDIPVVDEFVKKRDRLFAISPELWTAYAEGIPATTPGVRPMAQEYWKLFMKVTPPQVAPFYLQAAAGFFAWLRLAGPAVTP